MPSEPHPRSSAQIRGSPSSREADPEVTLSRYSPRFARAMTSSGIFGVRSKRTRPLASW